MKISLISIAILISIIVLSGCNTSNTNVTIGDTLYSDGKEYKVFQVSCEESPDNSCGLENDFCESKNLFAALDKGSNQRTVLFPIQSCTCTYYCVSEEDYAEAIVDLSNWSIQCSWQNDNWRDEFKSDYTGVKNDFVFTKGMSPERSEYTLQISYRQDKDIVIKSITGKGDFVGNAQRSNKWEDRIGGVQELWRGIIYTKPGQKTENASLEFVYEKDGIEKTFVSTCKTEPNR